MRRLRYGGPFEAFGQRWVCAGSCSNTFTYPRPSEILRLYLRLVYRIDVYPSCVVIAHCKTLMSTLFPPNSYCFSNWGCSPTSFSSTIDSSANALQCSMTLSIFAMLSLWSLLTASCTNRRIRAASCLYNSRSARLTTTCVAKIDVVVLRFEIYHDLLEIRKLGKLVSELGELIVEAKHMSLCDPPSTNCEALLGPR